MFCIRNYWVCFPSNLEKRAEADVFPPFWCRLHKRLTKCGCRETENRRSLEACYIATYVYRVEPGTWSDYSGKLFATSDRRPSCRSQTAWKSKSPANTPKNETRSWPVRNGMLRIVWYRIASYSIGSDRMGISCVLEQRKMEWGVCLLFFIFTFRTDWLVERYSYLEYQLVQELQFASEIGWQLPN